ncbi:hypothetical protein O2W18_06980 [Modestobacter sp. VKM Ac-2983]|uniref:hypothetical protein n=1 Tax=Modestobacter sp. VKM Ac-2983 TaxID=3004137 RepID=UPI0022AB529A|nr:hypothetical protein [Modestobacter sp. VKM Ac-2983]MCZ2804835.1 hypothetical protein [Modestobacter sp. VKM Ac-2983]
MLQEDVEARLRIALTTTIVEEYSLFVVGALETPPSARAVAAQLASRLRHLFDSQWDVDVEYISRPTLGELRIRSRSLQLPATADIVIHRRGRAGRDNNMLMLVLMLQESQELGNEFQRLSSLMAAHGYQHAVLLNFNLACAGADGEPPVVVLPTWHWIDAETTGPDVVAKDAAHALCRRGHRKDSLLSRDGEEEGPLQLEMFPAVRKTCRIEILQQLGIRYGNWIRSDIPSAIFVQDPGSFTLEIHTGHGGDRPDKIDLDGYFEPADPVGINVAEFLRWSEDSMIMLCDALLEERAVQKIAISLGYANEEDYWDF